MISKQTVIMKNTFLVVVAMLFAVTFAPVFAHAEISGYTEAECSERFQRGVLTREQFDECKAYARNYGYTEAECSDRFQRGALTQIELEACNSHAKGDTAGNGAAGENTTSSGGSIAPTPQLSNDCRDLSDCKMLGLLRDFINIMSAVVGIVIVIMFAVRGMQYMTARDNAQQVTQAKEQFFWLVIALVVYLFSFSFLQWLVPGGIF